MNKLLVKRAICGLLNPPLRRFGWELCPIEDMAGAWRWRHDPMQRKSFALWRPLID